MSSPKVHLERASSPDQCKSPVTALSGLIGAEISGMDLARLNEAEVNAVHVALLEYKVVFFRDQYLGSDDQVVLARRLGPITTGHPTFPSPAGQPFILEQDSQRGARADHWHSDVTFVVEPPALTVLRAVELPSSGGDTLWASTEAGYNRLPGPLQRLAGELHAIHTNAYNDGPSLAAERDDATRGHRAVFTSTVFEAEHPVVQLHPATRRPTLLLGAFAKRIVGLPSETSRDVLRILSSYVTRPEHIVRWRWGLGDVAIWDNRATQHYAVDDFGDGPRIMHRVTVSGTRPVAPNGWRSESRRGDATAYLRGIGSVPDDVATGLPGSPSAASPDPRVPRQRLPRDDRRPAVAEPGEHLGLGCVSQFLGQVGEATP